MSLNGTSNLFVNRPQYIVQLSNALFGQQHVILTGPSGSGKSTILKTYESFSPMTSAGFLLLKGYEVELNPDLLSSFFIESSQKLPQILIIDDFDQITSDSVKGAVLRLLREGKKYGRQLVLSSRRQLDKAFTDNAVSIRVTGFKPVEIEHLLQIHFENKPVPANVSDRFAELAKSLGSNPAAMNIALMVLQENGYAFDEFYKDFAPRMNLWSKRLRSIDIPPIIVPVPPAIIPDARVINQALFEKIKKDPKAVYGLTGRQFEMLVAEMFDKMGYQVKLTQETRDGGKDLIIVDKREVGDFLIYAECKKFAPDRPVGVGVVSNLNGRLDVDRATAGLIITTSYFTPDAKTFTEKIRHRMSLADFSQLQKWLALASANK
jgi:energy-coupling factor transporter ATP-binding protein EcfA2